jgi:hypothetical protein
MPLIKRLALIFIIIYSELAMTQNFDLEQNLFLDYEAFKENTLTHRRFKHSDILQLIEQLQNNKDFTVNKVGSSVEERDLFLISLGHGDIKVFLWSQMHGDEPTATAALFDIFNFFKDSSYTDFKKNLLSKVKLYFLPMVNPDGAEKFKRRNFFNIDINRDASRFQTPEAVILKEVFDSLKADFGFNLHDQDPRYSAGNSFRSAAISFLAPAYNYEKEVDPVRKKSIQLIGRLTKMLSMFIPGHIAKYSDDFEPRAFGDNFQKWGTSTILVESGGWKDDPEKQFLRKLNFVLLISAFKEIANNTYKSETADTYNNIPFNDRYLFDVLLRNITLKHNGKDLKIDVAVNFVEFTADDGRTIFSRSSIQDIGDLSIFFGYQDLDFAGHEIQPGKIYSEQKIMLADISTLDLYDYYKDGYTMLSTGDSIDGRFTEVPINISNRSESPVSFLSIGGPADFVLSKNGKIEYAVINGFIQKVKKGREFKGNGLIYK